MRFSSWILPVLHSYQNVDLRSTAQIPPRIGVGLVAGKMNSGFFWRLSDKGALWFGKADIKESLEANYGPRKLYFQCAWFDADNPAEHPDVAQLQPDRRFAEVVYRWYYHSELPRPPTTTFAVLK